MISTPVALLVLLSALMHAGWNYLVKASSNRFLDTVALTLAGSLVSACLLPFVPLPAPESWPWMGLTLIVHAAYFLVLIKTYSHADLSIAYPLMRGTAPVLVALAAPLFGEALSPGVLIGVTLIGAGITLPVWFGFRHGKVATAGIAYAFGNAFIIAAYTFFDGIGARLSGSAVAYTLWLFFLNAWSILAIAVWHHRDGVLIHLRRRWAPALAGSVLTVGSYGIVLWAMTVASIPAVAALREVSVIFAALFGTFLLREHMGRWRTIGAMLVALGAASIRWG